MTNAPGRRSHSLLPGETLAALAVAVVAIVVITGLSDRSLQERATGAAAVNHANEVRHHLNLFWSDLQDLETSQRGFLLTGNESHLELYNRARTSLPLELEALQLLTVHPDQQRDLVTLRPMMNQRLDELAQPIALQRAGKGEEALALVRTTRGRLAMDNLRAVVDRMSVVEERLLDERTADWQNSVTWSTYVTFAGSVVLFCAIMLIAWLASRDFRIRESEAWLRRVQMALNTQMQGDLRVEPLAEKILRVLGENLGAKVAALYVTEPGERLRRVAGHALEPSTNQSAMLRFGDGLTGQAAKENQMIHLRDVPEDYLRVTSALGRTKSREIVVVPVCVDGTVHALATSAYLQRFLNRLL
jgi:CHASE3 domain sensor protein/putative methionine-R-sulfoxide reductase with GAF domain